MIKDTMKEMLTRMIRKLGSHLIELFQPETPSYKTSITAAILFGIVALFTGEKYALFWLAVTCCGFFVALAAKQYGFPGFGKRDMVK